MNRWPRISVLGSDFGLHPEVLPLNPRFRPEMMRLRVDIEIEWKGRDPQRALATLEKALVVVSPSLEQHECRGHPEYRILSSRQRPAPKRDHEPVEMPLALAHLLEHIMIDTIAAITGERLVSGVTGARRDSPARFDVFVECPDPAVGALATQLSIDWVSKLLQGRSLDGTGPPTVQVARSIYEARPRALAVAELARHFEHRPAELASALLWLQDHGFVRRDGDLVLPLARSA